MYTGPTSVQISAPHAAARGGYACGDRHRELKVFVQGFRDFAASIAALKSGRVSREDNARLWGLLKANWECLGTAEFDLINHNLDVATLHFKYDRRASEKDRRASEKGRRVRRRRLGAQPGTRSRPRSASRESR